MVAEEVVVAVVVEVAEVMSIQGHQPPGKVHGRIGFGSRNRVAVGQEQGGGQVRGDGFGEPGCVAWRLRVSDAAIVSCLTGSDCSAKTGLDICLHSSNGWRLVILAVSCPGWQRMTRKESMPDHATQAGLPRSPRLLDHAEWMRPESLSNHPAGWGGPSSRRPAASSSLLGQRCVFKAGAPR